MRISPLLLVLRYVGSALAVAVLFVFLAPGCGRSSLEIEDEDGGPPTGVCNATTCPSGCCDASNVCRLGTDGRFCGAGGGRCTDCIATGFEFCDASRKTCARNVQTCDATTCPSGCCTNDGGRPRCVSGSEAVACGQGGLTCVNCTLQGRACDPRLRVCSTQRCDASNCNGCCVGNQCLGGTSPLSCGNLGNACVSCAAGQVCRTQPGGGGRCEGVATCGPMNCGGCCRNGQCLNGADTTACGRAGQQCATCGPNQTCNPNTRVCQNLPTCGPLNCAGCCVGNQCVLSPTAQQCGRNGAQCAACPPNNDCQAGVCVPRPCGPLTCLGCCNGAGNCVAGTQNNACGQPTGVACTNCSATGKICDGPTRTCVSPCNPGSCPNGCCNGDVCVTGIQNDLCGTGGLACQNCNATNQVCQGQQCRDRCGPLNCAGGCCLPSNACTLGVANSACGSNGAACANCTANNSVCDTAANPRACTNAGSCPSPYNQCPGGTTMPITPQTQGLCPDVDLSALQGACGAGPDTPSCQTALQTLAAINPACATCIRPFAEPFNQLNGIYRCVAPFVNNTCRGNMGCAADCQRDSCDQCPPAAEDQCRTDVIQGQCGGFFGPTAGCVGAAIGPGQPGRFCNPTIYPILNAYGAWLRAVGDRYCGNGP